MSSLTEQLPLTLADLQSGPPTVSVERAGQYLGVSRAFAYQMAREGLLPTIKLGARRVRVPAAALLRMLSGEQ
ncbi:helix-turn-helix domain-containing protein [Mycobacterium sp. 2-64]|uniref:helix-turn-helix domain-containing protein n=1 Tax=Mycobacterium sp. 2-64 TaxID=3042319 RepID=UPI002DDC0842|nr:helix-turn-helix domain-containing protein [Mycobacterium sp. 2-64]WSE52713.1 helix-turn-helix domain-containing protein [Mycobacterium sp. 2-64]